MSRLQAALALLLVVPVTWALMWWGWRGRLRRGAHVPPLPGPPADLGSLSFGPVEALYVSTTPAGDYLNRVAAQRLGVRSTAQVGVHAGGVMIARQGETAIWIPVDRVAGAHRQRGMVGKFADAEGLVVITWRHGADVFGTGLRTRYARDREPLVAAVGGLVRTGEENTNG